MRLVCGRFYTRQGRYSCTVNRCARPNGHEGACSHSLYVPMTEEQARRCYDTANHDPGDEDRS